MFFLFIIHQIFEGNTDQTSEVRNVLDRPIITKKIRFSPKSWQNSTANMRVELVGCPLKGIKFLLLRAILLYDRWRKLFRSLMHIL